MRTGKLAGNGQGRRGFSLIELLVIIGTISILLSISLPALKKAKGQALRLININRQKQVIMTVGVYALDNDDWYPESVATVGPSALNPHDWGYTDPRQITAVAAKYPGSHRAMSEYFRGYIEDASTFFCPNAPGEYEYLQDAWDAGDRWDNPATNAEAFGMGPSGSLDLDRVVGTYGFYWNYRAFIRETGKFYSGPRKSAGSPNEGRLLMSDHLERDTNASKSVLFYGSCERFRNGEKTPEVATLSQYWRKEIITDSSEVTLQLNGGYIDGHVGNYSAQEVYGLVLIQDQSTNALQRSGATYFLPEKY